MFASVFACLAGDYATAAPFTLNDIDFWIGAGANRAALAIDWQESGTNPPALVWGYRWSGTATGAKMLTDIVSSDPGLFAKLGGTLANPKAVYGLGYDANGNSQFGVNDDTVFDAAGIAITTPADLALATDSGDYYAEGWYTGFWHYGIAATNPYDGGAWADTGIGMAGRQLADGAWDSWTFSPTFNFAAFAANPQPAPSPFPPGDFDRNGLVEAADYARWKSLYGSTIDPSADGNRDGVVNAADYTVWRNHFGAGQSASQTFSLNVPEPISAGLMVIALMLSAFRRARLLPSRSCNQGLAQRELRPPDNCFETAINP